MNEPLSEDLLVQLDQFLSARMGLYFLPRRRADLERGIAAAASDFGFQDVPGFARWLVAQDLSRDQIKTLAAHLTIGETYFFRDPRVFEALEMRVLPELIQRHAADRRLRIWSAGCATGEEPYSLAILLDKLLPHRPGWHITILATEINSQALRKAETGIYTEWSFRDTPAWIRNYFQKLPDGRSEILPRIKHMIFFDYLNLVEDVFPSLDTNTNAMDLIFCRNVLMYLTSEQARRTVRHFHRSLVQDGYLVVSASELSTTLYTEFTAVTLPGAILYRSDNDGQARAPQSAPLFVPPPPSQISSPVNDLPLAVLRPELPAETPTASQPLPPPAEGRHPPPNLYEQAVALYQAGAYAESSARLQSWLALHPDDASAMAFLARAFANLGELTQAHAWSEKAIARDKLNPSAHYLYATICQEQGDADCARSALQRALYLQPDLALAHYALGMLSLRQGQRKQADKHLRNALQLVAAYPQQELLPESEGMTAGRLQEIIRSTVAREKL